MNQKNKFGLTLFMIGLAGAVVNRESIMFWVAFIPIIIGSWLFLSEDKE